MKRLLLATTGTVAGLAALLSFKTHAEPIAGAASLPSDSSTSSAPTKGSDTSNASTSAVPSSSASGSAPSASRSYVGKAVTTRYGVIQVKATVSDDRITEVAFVQLTAFDGHSQQINSFAGPELLKETIAGQTAQVDTVSGASYTSEGYRESLQSALDEAGLR